MEQAKQVKYGKDEMTASINRKAEEQKTEDWHCDFDGSITIDGQLYYLNLYDKKGDGSWMAGKVKKAEKKDDLPF